MTEPTADVPLTQRVILFATDFETVPWVYFFDAHAEMVRAVRRLVEVLR
jgi:hypothetical protein